MQHLNTFIHKPLSSSPSFITSCAVCCSSQPSSFLLSIDEHISQFFKKNNASRLTIDGKPFVPVDVFWKLDNRLKVALDD